MPKTTEGIDIARKGADYTLWACQPYWPCLLSIVLVISTDGATFGVLTYAPLQKYITKSHMDSHTIMALESHTDSYISNRFWNHTWISTSQYNTKVLHRTIYGFEVVMVSSHLLRVHSSASRALHQPFVGFPKCSRPIL